MMGQDMALPREPFCSRAAGQFGSKRGISASLSFLNDCPAAICIFHLGICPLSVMYTLYNSARAPYKELSTSARCRSNCL